ncbi:MAG: arylsulfatase [Pirellulaceae bacterium]
MPYSNIPRGYLPQDVSPPDHESGTTMRYSSTRKFVLNSIAAALLIVGVSQSPLRAQPETPQQALPNVVLLMTDDQGYGDLSIYGNPELKTPNLDELARASVQFTNFHSDPTCSETRAALLTGRYASRTGVWHTIMGRSILRRDETTLADLMENAGYATGIFGKWHLGDNFPYRPQDRGFQRVVVHGGGGVGQTPDYFGNDYFDDHYFDSGEAREFTGYCTDIWFAEGMKFIRENKERPFFCYLPTNAPHGPFLVADSYKQPYLDMGIEEPRASFYGMIANIDENIGKLTQFLEDEGLAENTILIFMSDNGTAAGFRGSDGFNAGMRAKKGSPYDGGHRVPCFVRWPAKGWEGGRTRNELAAHFDLIPTLAEVCGLDLSETLPLDGKSLVPLLSEQEVNWPERTLFVHSQRVPQPQKWRNCAVLTQRWRLVNGKELYDTDKDPGQKQNLAEQHPEVVQSLREKYETWWESISTRFDELVPIDLGHPVANPTTLTAHDWHTEDPLTPWHQNHIKDKKLAWNGFWAVRVAEDGLYRITLRRWPETHPGPLEADLARIRIGEVEQKRETKREDTLVSFTAILAEGETQLQTWLTNTESGLVRGAYYVDVEKMD